MNEQSKDNVNHPEELQAQAQQVEPAGETATSAESPAPLPAVVHHRKFNLPKIITCIFLGLTVITALVRSWITATPLSAQTETDLAYRIGSMAGSLLFVIIVTFFVWRFICKRQMGKGMLIYSVIILLMVVGSLVNSLADIGHMKTFMNDMQTVQRRLINGDPLEFTRNDEERYGRYAMVMDQLIDFIERQKQLSDELGSDLEKMLLGSIFTAESLATPETITGAQQKLDELDELYERYSATYSKRQEEYAAFAREIQVPRQLERYFSFFQQGVEQGIQVTVEMISYEKETTAATRNFLEFLKPRVGQFELKEGIFSFTNPEDQQVFRNYAAEIYRIQQKQMEKLESMQFIGTPQQ